MNNCAIDNLFSADGYTIDLTTKNKLEYQDFRQDLFENTNFTLKPLNLTEMNDKLISEFPLIIKKHVSKRSSDGPNPSDMPVVFMPKKSVTECVSKPKVEIQIFNNIFLKYF